MSEENKRIVCAANKHKDRDIMLIGARHWDKLMHKQWEEVKKLVFYDTLGRPDLNHFDFIQGFIDNMGDFHTREEALKIATEANQILKKTGGEGSVQLFSEDLY